MLETRAVQFTGLCCIINEQAEQILGISNLVLVHRLPLWTCGQYWDKRPIYLASVEIVLVDMHEPLFASVTPR